MGVPLNNATGILTRVYRECRPWETGFVYLSLEDILTITYYYYKDKTLLENYDRKQNIISYVNSLERSQFPEISVYYTRIGSFATDISIVPSKRLIAMNHYISEIDGKLYLYFLQNNKKAKVKVYPAEGLLERVFYHDNSVLYAGEKGIKKIDLDEFRDEFVVSTKDLSSILGIERIRWFDRKDGIWYILTENIDKTVSMFITAFLDDYLSWEEIIRWEGNIGKYNTELSGGVYFPPDGLISFDFLPDRSIVVPIILGAVKYSVIDTSKKIVYIPSSVFHQPRRLKVLELGEDKAILFMSSPHYNGFSFTVLKKIGSEWTVNDFHVATTLQHFTAPVEIVTKESYEEVIKSIIVFDTKSTSL